MLLKVTDIQAIKDHEHLLVNLQWIMTMQSAPSGPVMNTVQFLTKICSQVPKMRKFLRDNIGLMSTLTALLTTLATSAAKSGKVFDLMRFVVQGIIINRQESYQEKLIFHLLR